MNVYQVQVMKPATINKDNLKEVVKLEQLLQSPEYAIEEKIDGCHYNIYGALILSTDKVDKTDNFPHLRDFFVKLGMPNLILDGEMYYPGKTSQFCTRVTGASAGAAEIFQKTNGYMHYKMFDILRTPKGTWTFNNPYQERRKILEYFYTHYIVGTPMQEYIEITDMTIENKKEFVNNILEHGGEGGVLKKLTSLYIPGKKPKWEWMKIKQADEVDLIIIGFDPPTRDYTGKNFDDWPYWVQIGDDPNNTIPVTKYFYNDWIGAVQLGIIGPDGEYIKVCSASGIDEKTRQDMSEHKDKYLGKVARISYMEKTEAGNIRHPTFKELHPDKQPEDCTWDFGGDEEEC